MTQLNIEIKARSNKQNDIREILKSLNAEFKGVDHQVDTYFKVNSGRLKLREGNIENSLVHYEREDIEGPKRSNVTFYKSADKFSLKEILSKALGILVVVDKTREIYFIENVKFHIDSVKDLGTFVEIEAIDFDGKIGKDKLYEQCKYYLNLFKIKDEDLISDSYSDMLLRK
ncbi:MAG: CYTH domain-containing protein [Ignavibacteriaceae bacterium]|nr:CYTH domain-containing protein [Ignavibacteriaceae bacterium]